MKSSVSTNRRNIFAVVIIIMCIAIATAIAIRRDNDMGFSTAWAGGTPTPDDFCYIMFPLNDDEYGPNGSPVQAFIVTERERISGNVAVALNGLITSVSTKSMTLNELKEPSVMSLIGSHNKMDSNQIIVFHHTTTISRLAVIKHDGLLDRFVYDVVNGTPVAKLYQRASIQSRSVQRLVLFSSAAVAMIALLIANEMLHRHLVMRRR